MDWLKTSIISEAKKGDWARLGGKWSGACSNSRVRRLLPALCLALSALTGSAMELGQSRDGILAQHGQAAEENHSKHTATYRQGGWRVDLQYCDDVACKLTFSKIGEISEGEIQSILSQNSGGMEWQEAAKEGGKRTWQRTDFASATCIGLHPGAITFSQAPPRAEQPAQEAMAEATPALDTPKEDSPGPYAIQKTTPAPTSGDIPATWLNAATNFVKSYPLVFLIPAILLIVSLLLGRKRKRPAPEPPARRVVVPRPVNDAMAVPRSTKPADLAPDDFELLVGEMFRRGGYAVEISGGLGSDGGYDLVLRKGEKTTLVQCRQWGNWKVSAPPMKEFVAMLEKNGTARGIFVTSGEYTEEAIDVVEGKPIELIDGAELNRMIAEVKGHDDLCNVQSWLGEFASAVTVLEPTCPFCHERMTLKRGIQGRPFWSCRSFPRCAGKRDGRVELLQRITGTVPA